MKFGIRKPSIRKKIAARTSAKRYVRHNLGLKAPRGWGWLTNPKQAAYNRIYNRTTVGVDQLGRGGRRRKSGCACCSAFVIPLLVTGTLVLAKFSKR